MLAVLIVLSAALTAAPQQPPPEPPISLERIRKELQKPPGIDLNRPLEQPVATFRITIEQPRYVPTIEEWIREEFKLTALQRQSADWGAKCCGGYLLAGGSYGVRLDPLFKSLEKALQRRRARKIREQIARELAELEARRKREKAR